MAASLLRRGTYNSRDIRFELEATIVVFEEEKEAMQKLGPKVEVSPATKRLWQELQQEKIALEGLYMHATGDEYSRPQPVCDRDMKALEIFFEAMHGRRWLDLSGWLGRTATANTRGVPPFSCNPWCWAGVECSVGDVQGLKLSNNQLQGVLPGAALTTMSGVVTLDLSGNEIGGTLPPELGKMVHLQYLRLAVSKLEGPIPDTLGDIKGLRELDISHSRLSGLIPPSLGCCTKLSLLNLSHNRLSGSMPPEIGNFRALRELFLGHNRLTGRIPSSFADLVRLRSLSLSCNRLEGTLSPWLGKLTCLHQLLLDHNQLSGRLPKAFRNLRDIKVAHFQHNCLSGTIPRCLGELTELRVLNLAGNRLQGVDYVENAAGTRRLGKARRAGSRQQLHRWTSAIRAWTSIPLSRPARRGGMPIVQPTTQPRIHQTRLRESVCGRAGSLPQQHHVPLRGDREESHQEFQEQSSRLVGCLENDLVLMTTSSWEKPTLKPLVLLHLTMHAFGLLLGRKKMCINTGGVVWTLRRTYWKH